METVDKLSHGKPANTMPLGETVGGKEGIGAKWGLLTNRDRRLEEWHNNCVPD